MALSKNTKTPSTNSSNNNELKQFNKDIRVTVSVDSIAEMLCNSFDAENPHRFMLTNTLIDLGLKHDTLTYLYNNLNGFTNEINFKIGQPVYCTDTYYNRIEGGRKEIGNCRIIDIDLYSNHKVKVQWENDGKSDSEAWTEHHNLSEPKYTSLDEMKQKASLSNHPSVIAED